MISNRKKLFSVKKYFTTPLVPRNEETHEQFMRFLIHNEFLKDWLYELLLIPGVEIEERKPWTDPLIFVSQLFPQVAADDIMGDRAQRKGLKAKIAHESLLPG